MQKKLKYIKVLTLGVFSLALALVSSCNDDMDAVIEHLKLDRVLSPIGIEVRVLNQIDARIIWEISESVDYYVVEVSNDSLEFNSIVHAVDVLPEDVPYTVTLEGQEKYSVRIKGVSSDSTISESKWSSYYFETGVPNFINQAASVATAKTNSIELKWDAGISVTHFLIKIDGSDDVIKRDISNDEIVAGSAVITNLISGTPYIIRMYNDLKQKGEISFQTLVEGTPVYPTDDLSFIIDSVPAGDTLALYAGDYTVFQGTLDVNKPIVIKGVNPNDKPKIHIQFVLGSGATDVVIADVEMCGLVTDSLGTESVADFPLQITSAAGGDVYNSLKVNGCVIHDYKKSIISGGSAVFTISSILINDCIVYNIKNDGGDNFDFRKSFVGNLTLSNSTFTNCGTEIVRDFVRMDGSAQGNTYDDGVNSPVIDVDHCTFQNVMNSDATMKRFFYVRWSLHTILSTKNLFADMGMSVYSNQSLTQQPNCTDNNYFNAVGYYDIAGGAKVVDNGNYTTHDPGFADAPNRDFTVSNEDIIFYGIGDPRWR
ncbi:MAG: DUF4957 domain-containing protein [Marinilabiliaceae bacterium]|nr:DUF4957 domain-containing protein [Marinilabiliaceae bacterium]